MKEALKTIAKILIPIAIGIGVFVWLFSGEFSIDIFKQINFDSRLIIALVFAILFVVGRDWGMCWRFVTLTDRTLSWQRSLKVTMLCEFTSTITPTSVGGGALSMIFLNREGINWGRATTITMITLFLDELFFVISCPIVILLFSDDALFGFTTSEFSQGLKLIFWIIYIAIAIWTAILYLGIIAKPHAVKKILMKIFSWRLLRRWHKGMEEMSNNMLSTSIDIKTRSKKWWGKAFAATAISWLSRYLLVNALFWGLYPAADQLIVLARQFIVWAILMVSPTPGGSGVSEYLFTEYYGDMITGGAMVMILALLWRVLSYYIYLLIGTFMMPSFLAAKKIEEQTKRDNKL